MFTNRKQRLLALLARYRILRHRETKRSRQGELQLVCNEARDKGGRVRRLKFNC